MTAPADRHRIDQMLAQRAEAAAELATMYKTLLVETGDAAAAMELTKTWIIALFANIQRPPEGPTS